MARSGGPGAHRGVRHALECRSRGAVARLLGHALEIRASDEAWARAAAVSALGRVGRVDDVADVVAFLASDDGRWITGHWLDVTGGSLPWPAYVQVGPTVRLGRRA